MASLVRLSCFMSEVAHLDTIAIETDTFRTNAYPHGRGPPSVGHLNQPNCMRDAAPMSSSGLSERFSRVAKAAGWSTHQCRLC